MKRFLMWQSTLGRVCRMSFAFLLVAAMMVSAIAETNSEAPTPTPTGTATSSPAFSPADSPAPSPATVAPSGTGATPSPQASPGENTEAPPDTKPECTIEGCAHVQTDENGVVLAVCALGEWMLLHPESTATLTPTPTASPEVAAIAPMSVTLPTNITLPATGTYTIYRSGSYILTGGSTQCILEVSANCVVALTIKGAKMDEMRFGANCAAEIEFTGISLINTLTLPSGTSVHLLGSGALQVNAVSGSGGITVSGGSVQLPGGISSQNGRVPFAFPAGGTTSATVDGAYYAYSSPDGSGTATLWLPPPGDAQTYTSTINGAALEVSSQQPEPSTSENFDLSNPSDFVGVADKVYNIIKTAAANPKILRLGASNITLQMSSLDASGIATIQMDHPGTLYLKGTNKIAKLTGSGQVKLEGSGSLYVETLSALPASVSSGISCCYGSGSPFQNWQQVPYTGAALPQGISATLDGKPVALCYQENTQNAFVANPPPAGYVYATTLTGTTLEITTVPGDGNNLLLDGANIEIASNGTYYITSTASATGSITVKDNVKAKLVFTNVTTSGSLILGKRSEVEPLTLKGSSVLSGGVLLGDNSKIVFGSTGALHTAKIAKTGSGPVSTTINGSANVTLPAAGGIAGNAAVPTMLYITGPSGGTGGLPNTEITLKIAKRAPQTITIDVNSYIFVWGSSTLTNVDAVVLSDANTYATVVTSGSGSADALPVISDVQGHDNGSITYTAIKAETSGVQYYVNKSGAKMPDTYVADAGRVLMAYDECNIPGLKDGDEVTFRVFASAVKNASLNAQTADGFQFSDQYTFTVKKDVRVKFTLPAQHKTYDGVAFVFGDGKIPKGAGITWYKGNTKLSGAPKDAGTYTARVNIPKGDSQYLPGDTDVTVVIEKIVVWIFPEFYYKLEGEPDPEEFLYTYTGTLWGDKVTGLLTRTPGEESGNYPYLTDQLVAPSYYQFKVDPDSPMFFIFFDPSYFGPGGGGSHGPYDPLAKIDPIHDVLVFSDGKKLDLITATVEKLNISGTHYGVMVTDVEDGKARPFTPSLRLRPGYDAALLILQAEPELRKDGGYETDMDGNPVVRGRKLTLSYSHLVRMKEQRITHIAFGLDDTYCFLDLAELENDAVKALMEEKEFSRNGARYVVTIHPITNGANVPESAPAAAEAALLRQPLSEVRVELRSSAGALEISPVLRQSKVMFDVSTLLQEEAAEPESDVSETVIGKAGVPKQEPPAQENPLKEVYASVSGETTPTVELMELARKAVQDKLDQMQYALHFFSDIATVLDSRLVVPYTASETEAAIYPAILHTKPYLSAPLAKNGLYGLSSIFANDAATQAN